MTLSLTGARPYAPPTYPNPNTIVVLGSSDAAGFNLPGFINNPQPPSYVSFPGTWPAYLATFLGSSWTVINRSIAGTGTAQSIARFYTDVVPHRPSHVIICTGPSNDNYNYMVLLQNTARLCQMCESIGAIPIVRGAYQDNNYSAGQYQQMLSLNNALDLIGAHRIDHMTTLDNGAGGYVGGTTYQSGDGLHASLAGHAVRFNAIDLGIFASGLPAPRRLPQSGSWALQGGTSGSGLTLDTTTNLLGGGLMSFTMAARIKVTTPTGASGKVFLAAQNQFAYGSGSPLRVRNVNGTYDLADAGAAIGTASSINPTTDTTAHHVALTYNEATNVEAFYVDGVLVASGAPSSPAIRCASFFWGGRGLDGAGSAAAGYTFSDVTLWAVPLSAAQLVDVARNRRVSPASLVVQADFSISPIAGGVVGNAVNNGVAPIIGSAVWAGVTPI